VVAVQPVDGAGYEVASDFVAAVVEYETPPVRVEALAGVLVFVKGCAVVTGKPKVVY
jgi:hypothetical protein